MSYSRFVVLYDVVDSAHSIKTSFLEERVKVYDSVEEAFKEIDEFIYKYNHLKNFVDKDQAFMIIQSEEDCLSHFETKEFNVVAHTVNNQFRIIIKKLYSN